STHLSGSQSPPMPFDFYLNEPPSQHLPASSSSDSLSSQPQRLQLQIPSMLPTLAHGGGGEVLPWAMFASPYSAHPHSYDATPSAGPSSAGGMTMGDAWMLHNGFGNMGFVGQQAQHYPTYPNLTPGPESASSHSHSQPLSPVYSTYSSSPVVSAETPTASSYPAYSTSGLDLMGLLARVSARRNKLHFILTFRRFDSPVIYCSQNFCELTGYSSKEVIGRNCRFLQAPPGSTPTKGSPRPHSSEMEAHRMAKMLQANKECQEKLINYRKDGTQFVNLVTVIPVVGGGGGVDEDKVCFHVGFQTDIGGVSGKILQGVEGGRWVGMNAVTPYTPSEHAPTPSVPPNESKPARDSTTADPNIETLLDRVLLEMGPDIIWVVSLKGTFLYVSPSVKRVLGYEPEELVNKSLGDLCHPKDLVPLLRELKESCALGDGSKDGDDVTTDGPREPKVVDLIFRALSKSAKYVWLHSRGRLHIEPGKGRKAIILSARAHEMSKLTVPLSDVLASSGQAECWGTISKEGIVLHVGESVRDVLGIEKGEVVGRRASELMRGLSEITETMRLSRLGQPVALLPRHIPFVQGTFSLYPIASSSPAKVEGFTTAMEESSTMEVDPNPTGGHETGVSVARETNNVVSPPPIIFRLSLSLIPPPSHHQPHRNVVDLFEELGVMRGTSWQYELQQLKFANDRLKDEIRSMEALAQSSSPMLDMASSPTMWQSSQQHQQHTSYYPYGGSGGGSGDYGYALPPTASSSSVSVVTMGTTLSSVMPSPSRGQSSKRSWDVMDGGG
ncbi:blue light receptor, partial [Flagelloscypha sp. PMI_526]